MVLAVMLIRIDKRLVNKKSNILVVILTKFLHPGNKFTKNHNRPTLVKRRLASIWKPLQAINTQVPLQMQINKSFINKENKINCKTKNWVNKVSCLDKAYKKTKEMNLWKKVQIFMKTMLKINQNWMKKPGAC